MLGKILWTDLTVANAEEVRAFYREVVGWGEQPVSMGDYDDHCMTAEDGQVTAGICSAKGVNEGLPAQWLNYIGVADIEASLASVERLGGKVLRRTEGYAVVQDPAGAVFVLSTPSATSHVEG